MPGSIFDKDPHWNHQPLTPAEKIAAAHTFAELETALSELADQLDEASREKLKQLQTLVPRIATSPQFFKDIREQVKQEFPGIYTKLSALVEMSFLAKGHRIEPRFHRGEEVALVEDGALTTNLVITNPEPGNKDEVEVLRRSDAIDGTHRPEFRIVKKARLTAVVSAPSLEDAGML